MPVKPKMYKNSFNTLLTSLSLVYYLKHCYSLLEITFGHKPVSDWNSQYAMLGLSSEAKLSSEDKQCKWATGWVAMW